ncbi:MAG: hypothetical protein NVSMB48_05620 [Marmoricola sp.]
MSVTLSGYLDEPDAATTLGYSPLHLSRLRRRGDGPVYIRRGRAVVYKVSDLEEWMDERRVSSAAS